MILITAHEGCEKTPPNTLESVKEGINSGADIVEVDVRSTKDGIVILSHNSKIKTINNKDFPINSTNYADILQFEKDNLLKYESQGGKLTRLDEVFELIRGTNIVINIDIKDEQSIHYVVKSVKTQNMQESIFISGCETKCATYFKSAFPEFRILLNIDKELTQLLSTGTPSAISTVYEHAINTGCCGINIQHTYCSVELVEYLHKRFMPVSVWTVDTTENMQKYIDMGVFSITTNRPRTLKKLLSSI